VHPAVCDLVFLRRPDADHRDGCDERAGHLQAQRKHSAIAERNRKPRRIAKKKTKQKTIHSMKVTVLGAGAWGTALERLLHESKRRDRKSTRLNSSHRTNSYAVFCLKKKKKKK